MAMPPENVLPALVMVCVPPPEKVVVFTVARVVPEPFIQFPYMNGVVVPVANVMVFDVLNDISIVPML